MENKQTNVEKTPKVIKIATLATIAMTVIVLAFGGLITKWASQSADILNVSNSPVPVQPSEVKSGDKVMLAVNFCKKAPGRGITTVQLLGETSGAKIDVNWPLESLDPVCSSELPNRMACDNKDTLHKCIPIPLPIPAQTPADIYHAEFRTCYDINPLKKNKCMNFTTQRFKVLNANLNLDSSNKVR